MSFSIGTPAGAKNAIEGVKPMLLGATQPQTQVDPNAPGGSGQQPVQQVDPATDPAGAQLQQDDIRKGQEALEENKFLKTQLQRQKQMKDMTGSESFVGAQVTQLTQQLPKLLSSISGLQQKMAADLTPKPLVLRPSEPKPAEPFDWSRATNQAINGARMAAADATTPRVGQPAPPPQLTGPPTPTAHDGTPAEIAQRQHAAQQRHNQNAFVQASGLNDKAWYNDTYRVPFTDITVSPRNIVEGIHEVARDPLEAYDSYANQDGWWDRTANSLIELPASSPEGSLGSWISMPAQWAGMAMKGLPRHFAQAGGMITAPYNLQNDVAHLAKDFKDTRDQGGSVLDLVPGKTLFSNIGDTISRIPGQVMAFGTTLNPAAAALGLPLSALSHGGEAYMQQQPQAPAAPAPSAPVEEPVAPQDPAITEQLAGFLKQIGAHLSPYLAGLTGGNGASTNPPAQAALPSAVGHGGHAVSNVNHYM